MNYESLYEQSKWKKQHQLILEQQRQEQIKQLSSSKKINNNSNLILINKLYDTLSQFKDQTPLNIQTSIPLLHATRILQVIENIDSAKQKLERGEFENSRLKEEARFVYCLWKMIDEEQIQTRQLKEVIYMLQDKNLGDIKKALSQIYKDYESVVEFVQSWKILQQDVQYYKSIQKMEKKMQVRNQQKEIQKVIGFDSAVKEGPYRNETKEIRQLFLNTQGHNLLRDKLQKQYDYLTMESMNYSSKNKENVFIDRTKEEALVKRLYQNDRYKMREVQKKIEEEQKSKRQLEKCTFKPELIKDRLRSASNNKRSSSINGYEKTVHRMKVGLQKNKIEKQKRQYTPVGENYQKLREKKINPPKFLQRKKEEEPVLFVIEFDLGRHRIKVKIHESDSEEAIARNLCKIYCLKQDYFEQIRLIVRKERQIYEQEQNQ